MCLSQVLQPAPAPGLITRAIYRETALTQTLCLMTAKPAPLQFSALPWQIPGRMLCQVTQTYFIAARQLQPGP